MTMDYSGTELELFAKAVRWKAYWGRFARPHITGKVLEVGAGLGANMAVLQHPGVRSWLCLEPDPRLAAAIRARPDLPEAADVMTATIHDLPATPAFDTVLYLDVLEHIEDDAGELRAALDRLTPGGRLVVFAPAHNWLFSPFDAAIGHHRRYSRSSLRRAMPNGAPPLSARYLDSAGALLSLANRFLLRSPAPTQKQILFWDRRIVPVSRLLDPVLGFRLGKNLLMVWRKEQ